MLTDSVGQEFKMVQQGWILFAFCSLGLQLGRLECWGYSNRLESSRLWGGESSSLPCRFTCVGTTSRLGSGGTIGRTTSCGMDSLTAWWPQSSWASYMVAQGSKSKGSDQQDGHCTTSSELILEATQCHFCHILWVTNGSLRPAQIHWAERGPLVSHLSVGRVSKNLWPFLKHTLSVLLKNNSLLFLLYCFFISG